MRFPWLIRVDTIASADIPTLLQALLHKKPEIRLAAAVALTDHKTRDPGVMEALVGVLDDEDSSEVRQAAGTALNLMRTRVRAAARAAA